MNFLGGGLSPQDIQMLQMLHGSGGVSNGNDTTLQALTDQGLQQSSQQMSPQYMMMLARMRGTPQMQMGGHNQGLGQGAIPGGGQSVMPSSQYPGMTQQQAQPQQGLLSAFMQ